jgi:hypothetical protein
MKASDKAMVRSFVPETLLYGALAAGFCSCVARFLRKALVTAFHRHPALYAILALALMIFQGFVLERSSHALFWLLRRRSKERP